MDQLVAAVDGSASTGPVLDAAREIAPMFADELVALTVCERDPAQSVVELAHSHDARLVVRRGDPVAEIVDAALDDEVRGIVIGSRGLPTSHRPIGSTALAVIQAVAKPVVVVPPNARIDTARRHRLLVPLDGTGETAQAVQTLLRRLVEDVELDVVALHVFDATDMPAFSDQPGHETDAWRDEFLSRWLPIGRQHVTLETRVGRPAEAVPRVARDVGADVVAIGWKHNLAPGRARVVTSLLADSELPVVLVSAA